MSALLSGILIIFLLCVTSAGIHSYAETSVCAEDLVVSEEYQIGIMVKSIQKALENPESYQSFETIRKYGLDSRYYNMIRGWLLLELHAVESQHEATQEESVREKHKLKMEFLKRALRAIDLE